MRIATFHPSLTALTAEKGASSPKTRFPRMRAALRALWCVPMALTALQPAMAQTCAAPRDVILFLDNSGSIDPGQFDSMQQAIAGFAATFLAGSPLSRVAVVNWACSGVDPARDGCSINTVVNWSSVAANFAYVGLNNAGNQVCRTFSPAFFPSNGCGGVVRQFFIA